MPFPTLCERWHRQRAPRQTRIEHFRVECRDVRHRDTVTVAAESLEAVAGRYHTLTHDREVKAGTAAVKEALDHVVATEPDAELEARHAGLCHDEISRPDANRVANANLALHDARSR